jgi:UDP-GlcNAc3NAcA epimerase
LTDHAASLLFTPTVTATHNLTTEGIRGASVHQVGDVMYDAALYYQKKARRPLGSTHEENFILATVHRAENTDDPVRLGCIMEALRRLAEDRPVILPLHPRTRSRIVLHGIDVGRITMLDPVGYLEMLWLLQNCEVVVTDSGGLQKEAYFFGKPCVITRDQTEWVELVESGWNVLVGAANPSDIIQRTSDFIPPVTSPTIFGDGHAGERVASLLVSGT